MSETTNSQEDTAQDSGQDNLHQTPRSSESSLNRRRRIRDGGLGNDQRKVPEHPRPWRDRFKH